MHRLDRETSGCLLLAKNRQVLAQLHEMLRHERSIHIEKTYLALLDGAWPHGNKTIDIGINKVKRSGEHMMQADESGDRAVSHFEPLEVFDSGISRPCSLMKITIDTGRTHQIRVHARHSGHPIIGDSKYGDKATNQTFRKLGLKRLFLHASRLRFEHPADGKKIDIEAPLPEPLAKLLENLS